MCCMTFSCTAKAACNGHTLCLGKTCYGYSLGALVHKHHHTNMGFRVATQSDCDKALLS